MRNAELALHFDELADLYELDGAIVHRILAYRNAAKAIREAGASVAEMTRAGNVTELPGIGKTIEEKLTTLLDTGSIPSAEKLKAKYPPGLVEITRLPGLGPKRARRLFDELGIASLDELKQAAEGQRLRELKGFGPKAEESILLALAAGEAARSRSCCCRRRFRSPRRCGTPCASNPRLSAWRSRAAPGGGPTRARTSTSLRRRPTRALWRTRSARCR
jgi:DNA polymerase/3'-5' exonuclease PolX